MMLVEYCPLGEVQKIEQELWSLTMKGSDIPSYTTRFSDSVVLCLEMVTAEITTVERYIWGLSPRIQGNVVFANPSTFDSDKHLAQTLVDHRFRQGFMTATPEQMKGETKRESYGTRGKVSRQKRLQRKNKLKQSMLPQFLPLHYQ